MKDKFEEAAKECAGFYGFRYVGVREIAAILRESFPEPAPAEQGEEPTREWIRCQAEDVADYIRDTTLKLSTAPAGNKVVSYPLCKTREEAIDKVIAFSRALLASRPQPEAATAEGYQALVDRHIRELRGFAARRDSAKVKE